MTAIRSGWFASIPFALFAAALTGCSGGDDAASAPTGGSDNPAVSAEWFDYQRQPEFENTTRLPAEYITMSDGVKLSAQVMLPADADGNAASSALPVILTQTGYNKSASGYVEGFAFNAFLVEHGYAHVTVDVRGTGTSQGTWEIFSEREQLDYKEVLDRVVIDVSRAHFWDISAIGALDKVVERMRMHGRSVQVVGLNEASADLVDRHGATDRTGVEIGLAPHP